MPQYIRSLDGLRALAVTLVMMFHYQILPMGWMGVQIFFVLSGYLITRILLNEKQFELDYYLKRFYWRRTIRIFPIYFTYLILLAVAYLLKNFPEGAGDKFPYLFTYTYNFTRISANWSHSPYFTHLWSLSVEEQFYLVWPLLVYLLPGRALKIAILVIIALGPVVRYIIGTFYIPLAVSPEDAGEAIYWFTLSHFDAFAIGGAIALWRLGERLRKPELWFSLSLAVVLLIGYLNWYSLQQQGFSYSLASWGYAVAVVENSQHVWAYSVLNFCFGLLIVALISISLTGKRNPLAVFNHSWLVNIGKVSYGMYLYHWAIMVVFYRVVPGFIGKGWLGFVFYFIAVYLVSWLSFTFYESFFLRFKDKYYTKPEQITAP